MVEFRISYDEEKEASFYFPKNVKEEVEKLLKHLSNNKTYTTDIETWCEDCDTLIKEKNIGIPLPSFEYTIWE